jgi:hypothetical protein
VLGGAIPPGGAAAGKEIRRSSRRIHPRRRRRERFGQITKPPAGRFTRSKRPSPCPRKPAVAHSGRRGAFRSWLRTIVGSRTADYWRAQGAGTQASGGSGATAALQQIADADSDLNRQWDEEHDHYVLDCLLDLVEAGVWAEAALRQEVEELDRDVAMALRLQEAHLRGAAVKHGYFDAEAVNAAYAEAFAWYGLRLESVDAQQAGEFLRSRCIGLQLAAALDNWASKRQWGSKGRSRLLAIARVADPDPWRDRLRDALERPDPRALKELVASARGEELPPATVVLLARAAEGTAEAERAVAVLRQAQQRHPDYFWVNHDLGFCLYKLRPPRLEEAIRYYTAAVALRPQSPGARLNLGVALKDKGQVDEAIGLLPQGHRPRPRVRPGPHQPRHRLESQGEAGRGHRLLSPSHRPRPQAHLRPQQPRPRLEGQGEGGRSHRMLQEGH